MNDFSKYLLVSDFDRTLTDRDSRIPARNIRAILDFQRRGGLFTLGTGRSVPMYAAQRDLVPVNAPLILYNGAALYDLASDQLTDLHLLEQPDQILEFVTTEFPDLWVEIQGRDYHYVLGDNPTRDRFYRTNHAACAPFTLDRLPEPVIKIAVYGTFYNDTVAQFFQATEEELTLLNRAAARIAQVFPHLVVDRSAPRILDLQHKSVSKGRAARALAKRLGKTLVCVGDAANDLTMLEQADLAFVPADCAPEIARLGFPQVCPCGEGAVAGVIEALEKGVTNGTA